MEEEPMNDEDLGRAWFYCLVCGHVPAAETRPELCGRSHLSRTLERHPVVPAAPRHGVRRPQEWR
jgi:hypothetical protein